MTFYEKSEALSHLTLGKNTDYIDSYQPDLLQAVPRKLNRTELSVTSNALPFQGEDIWYGYELSWLNSKGKPIVAVAEFRFACESENIVESKSFKLYLNSFNQTRFASTEQVIEYLEKDLQKIVNGTTSVSLFPVDNCPNLLISKDDFHCIDELDITIDQYTLSAELLNGLQDDNQAVQPKEDVSHSTEQKAVEEHLVSHLLKSNCLITHQPDWASIYISYKGHQLNHEKLLRYLVSFRQHNEFHEQCVERIYCDIQRFAKLDELTIFARYTRRGGLDINPFRSTSLSKGPKQGRTIRQ